MKSTGFHESRRISQGKATCQVVQIWDSDKAHGTVSTLQYSLEGSFKEGLEQNDTDVLRRCLRTYATIDKMADAENLFRQHTVKPYMEEVSK